jgi:hypothetical protein
MLKKDKTKIGDGYGSECHLLRYMGRHRKKLDDAILKAVERGERIEWLDFGFDPKKRKEKWYDAELEGLDFLEGPGYKDVRTAWKKFWPQSGTSQNWDAVGWLYEGDKRRDLLLVEAKAHTGELKSGGCGAGEKSRAKIEDAFEKTIKYLKNTSEVTKEELENWCGAYYQFANRLAAIFFLNEYLKELGLPSIPAILVLVYFIGDKRDDGKECPTDKQGWRKVIAEEYAELGLTADHRLKSYVKEVYLPVTEPPYIAAQVP